MKTLFLVAIAVILAVIAVKQPDQTAQQAIWELYGKVKTVKIEATKPSSEPQVVEGDTDPAPVARTELKILAQEPAIPSVATPRNESAADPKQATEPPKQPALTAKPPEMEWPKIPPIPVQPAESTEISPQMTASAQLGESVEPAPNVEWEDINASYSRANRLLDDIP